MGAAENKKAYRERHPERDKQARREAKARWVAKNPEKYAEANRARTNRYRARFPEKVKATQKASYAANPLKGRAAHLKKKFGITVEFWNGMFEAQKRKCGCCGADDPGSKKGWQTDHCHFNGRIRAIVCAPCNILLSEHFQTNARKFIAYLERHS